MTVYRFVLDSLTCDTPRSEAPYTDHVGLVLVARQGEKVLAEIGSPIGNGDRTRAELNFGPGQTRSLVPSFWGDGTFIPWEVRFDMKPGDEPVEIGVMAINLRDVGDPYLVTRVSLVLASAALATGITYFFGSEINKALAEIIRSEKYRKIAERILGGAFDTVSGLIPSWVFDWEWPNCTGKVLDWHKTIDAANVVGMTGPLSFHSFSDDSTFIPSPERGCRQPVYRMQAHIVPDAPFGERTEPLRRMFVPHPKFDAALWTGDWRHERNDRSVVTIGAPNNRHYDVTAHEEIGGESVFDRFAPGLRETIDVWPVSFVERVPGRLYEGAVGKSAAAGLGARAGAEPMVSGGNTMSRSGRVGSSSLGDTRVVIGGPSHLSRPELPAPVSPPTPPAPQSDLISDAGAHLNTMANGVRTLGLGGLRLGLYQLVAVYPDRIVEEGTFVRYSRDATIGASEADLMLSRWESLG